MTITPCCLLTCLGEANCTYLCPCYPFCLPHYTFSNSMFCQNPCCTPRWQVFICMPPVLSDGMQHALPPPPSTPWTRLPFLYQGYSGVHLDLSQWVKAVCTLEDTRREPRQFFLISQAQEKLQIVVQSFIDHFQNMKSVLLQVSFYLILIVIQWAQVRLKIHVYLVMLQCKTPIFPIALYK